MLCITSTFAAEQKFPMSSGAFASSDFPPINCYFRASPLELPVFPLQPALLRVRGRLEDVFRDCVPQSFEGGNQIVSIKRKPGISSAKNDDKIRVISRHKILFFRFEVQCCDRIRFRLGLLYSGR